MFSLIINKKIRLGCKKITTYFYLSFFSASCKWLSAISAVSELECRKREHKIRGMHHYASKH